MENIDVSNALKITPSKSEDLIQARIDKIERLSAISRKIAAGTADYIANQAKTAEAKSNSAVGILSNVTGIDFTPEKSIIGTGLNTAVGLGSGLSRLSGYVASGIHDANALLLNKDIPQEVKDARARQLQGQATPEDEKLLALPRGDLTERKVAPNDFMHRVRKDFKSNLSQIQDMEESLKNAQSLREAFDFSSAVHQGTKDALTDDLKHTTVEDLNQVSEGWDALKQGKVIAGLKDMASGIAGSTPKIADAAIKHPLGTAQFLAENLPNTLAAATGAAGMVASNAAYALDTMGQGMTERTKALKGAMPTNEDLAWNALWSSTAGLAETYGDKLMGIPKLFKGAPKEVVEAAKDMNKSSFIKSLLNSGPVKTTAAIAEGAAGEYVTEGYQTWAENAAKVKETSLEEAFTGAAIGAITGGVMSGGIHGVAELAGSTPEKIKAKEDVVATQVAHDTAILNNDTTAYLDPTTPQYSPTKALEVLYAHAKLDTTTPEVKTTNLNKASDVVAMAEQDLKTVLEANDIAKRSPEQLIAAKDELVQLKSLIESTNPDDKSRLTALSQEVSYLERGLQASASKIAARQLTAEIKSRTTELNTARTLQEQLTTVVSGRVSPESVSKDIEVASLPLNVADQPAVESSQQAIGRLIKLSMANTQAITHEAATMLANDTANTLTDPQRLYLREFSAARIAQNKLQTTESVGATILSGDGLNLGLKQYQQYIGRALEAGNTKVASNYIAMLENFVDSHEQKAILATAAMEKAKDTNRSIKILKSKDGRWGYAPAGVEITREMIEKNGGLVLHPNSLKSNALAKAVPVEAEALKQALVAHKAAFALTFNQPATSVTPAAQTPATPSSAASVPSAVPPSPVPTTKESNVTQTPEAIQTESNQAAQEGSTATPAETTGTTVQSVDTPAVPKTTSAPNTSSVDTSVKPVQKTEESIQVTPPESYTNHSGGALGADSMFDTVGKSLGFVKQNHYYHGNRTPKGNVVLTDEQVAEGIEHAKKAAAVLKRPWNDKWASLLGRNWFQVKNATQVIAVAPLVQPGEKDSKGFVSKAARTTVGGGTGYAVEMAIANNKKVHVFDTKTNKWFDWKEGQFVESTTPVLDKNYAGIGSRQEKGVMTPASIQAIKDVYQNTLNPAKAKAAPVVIMPLGTSGSGKSTWIKSLPQDNLVVISPDEMRVEFTGDMNDKSKDGEIYAEVNKRVVAAISSGKRVVLDSTNLQKDRRRAFINAVKTALPDVVIQYKLMPLNPALAKQRIAADIAAGVNRANVPDSTIDRHAALYGQMLEDIKTEGITEYTDAVSNPPVAQTAAAPSSVAPVDSAENVREYTDAITNVSTELTKNATTATSTVIDADLISENTDVAILLEMLGVTTNNGRYTVTPSAKDILTAQARIVDVYTSVLAGTTKIADHTAELGKLLSWFKTDATTQDNPERKARAEKGAAKYGNGNPEAHLLIQLAEEMGELLSEVNRLTGQKDLSEATLEVQKRAFKVLRFGATTSNKDQKSIYFGKTNAEAYQQAVESAASPLKETVSVEKTAEVESRSEQAPESEEKTAKPIAAGTLSLFSQFKEKLEGTVSEAYKSTNLAAQYLKQSGLVSGATSQRALVAVKDFMSTWRDSTNKRDFLKEHLGMQPDQSFTTNEWAALKNFAVTVSGWLPVIQANLFKYDVLTQEEIKAGKKARNKHGGKSEYKMLDMLQYFYLDDKFADVEENVKTAIAASAYSYVVDRAMSPARMTDEDINTMHGKKEHESIQSYEGMKLLQTMASFEETAITQLGKAAVQALGIKPRDENTPMDILPRLENALGTQALELLKKQGFVKTSEHPLMTINGYWDTSSDEKLIENALKYTNHPGESVSLGSTMSMQNVRDMFKVAKGAKSVGPKQLATQARLRATSPSAFTVASKLYNPLKTLRYVSFVYKKDKEKTYKRELTEQVSVIKEASLGSKSVINKLFGIEKAPRIASTKPANFNQESPKDTNQAMPKLHQKVMQATQQIPHTLVPAMWQVSLGMGKDAILEIAGKVDVNVEDPNFQINNLPSVLAQNDNLENQFDLAFEQITQDGEEASWFVTGSIWSNLRNGYKEMSMNLQSSKIHRYLFTRPAWTVTLKFDDKPMVDEFLISLAMAMGTKTDQKRNEITLEDVFTEQTEDTPAQFHNPDIMEAAYIIQLGLQQGESGEVWTQANIDKVVSVTVGEGMMSLQALTAYANYLTAFDNKLENPDKVKDFSFTLLVGADGKTNGPMLTLLALGAADYQTLNRGGMFSDQEGSTATHFSEYYGEAQARDLYQQLGLDSVTDTMGKMATEEDILNWQADRYERHDTKYRMTAEELREQPFLPEQFQALEAIVGSLQLKAGLVVSALRNLVKKPITAFFFGSSVNNAVKGMENEFIQSIYDHIQGIKQGTKKTDITDLLSNINALIEMSDGPVLTISTLEEAMQLEFTMPQRASLQKSFVVLLGNSVKKKLESTFSTLIARRDVFNKTVQASYEIHAAAVANARINKINELMDQGKLAYRSTTVDGKEVRVPLRDLTKAEYDFVKRSLEHLQPVMHNAFSLEEDYLPAGIYMADSYVDKSTEPMYENAVKFPGNGGPDFKIHSESQLRKEKTPGLRGLPFSIHSSDSFGMQSALAAEPKAEALNVHDEISTGVANIAGSAMAINAATVNTFLHFSPAREALNMLERLVTRMATHVGQDKANPQTVRSMLSNWLDVYNHGLAKEDRIKFDEVADKTLRNAAANAYQVDIDRLTLISKMAYMDQYTWEGGQFKVTQEIRDEAVKQLEALKALKDGYLPSKEAQEAIRYLNTVAHAANKKDAVLPSWFEKTVDEVEEVDLPVKPNTWGVLGSNSLSESSVLSWFDKSDVLSAREVMDALVTEYKKTPKQASSKFALMLLEQLRKVVSPKLVVRMIRPDTAKSDVIGADTGTFDNVLGEYRLDGTEQAIYVMGPEFKNSGVTAELLLHELLHAALSWVLYDVKNGTGTAAANILYKSLDSLRQRAIERANKTKDLKHFAKILEGESGVDELISWGLSNQEFQTKVLREVTMAIALPSQTQGIVSMNGMQAFLQAIRKFFFRATKVEPVTETGLAVLLANVSGLFAEANTAEQKTARNINLSMAAQINTFSTLDIHEALDTGEVSDAFNDHLRNVLTNIVEKLHGSFGSFKESIMKSVPHSAIDAWALAQANGETPFVSDLQASGFQFNNQTYFVAEQVEATVKSILDSKDGKLSSVREELRKLEAEVRGKLTVQSFYQGPDWATATPQEQAEAQQLYDYLFKKVDDDYLARFAALGLSHEGFNALLKMPTKQAPVILKDRTVGNTLMNLFDRVLVALNGKLTHTKAGQAADVKLAALVRQLVEIENRKKAVLNQVSTGILAFADKKVRASRRGTKNQISKLVNSTMFKRNKNVTIAAVSHVVDAVMGNRVKYLVQNMNKMRNDVFPGAQGAIASALAEMNGNSHDLQKVLREGKAHLEGARKKIISYANKQALESFVDGGVYLADEAKSAVTNVLLRTGAHVLLGKYDMKQIADLVNNKATLLKEIASYEAQLSKFTPAQREIFLYQSKALGYHLAGYGEKSASLMKNASNIANLYTSAYQGQLNEADTLEATKTIDVLTTLYALQYSRSADIAALASVFTTENSRTDGDNNGLRMVLLMQQSSERESLARLFNDDPVQMAKGYIPEIYNPHTDLKAATKDEGEILENLGYKKVSDLGLDPHDVYREGHALYVMRDGGLRPWLSGMFSFTNMRAKGTKHHGERAVGTQNGLDRARQRAINDMALPGAGQNFDPTQVKENYMVPVLNPMGKAVNHQYLMQASTKDRLLERDSRFDTVLGALAGSVFDKDNSPKHNRKVVEVLHADFEKEFAKDAKAFRTVGPSSPDPELREIYAMLPQSTKDAIKDVWGSDSMLVHVGNLDIAFGYRKLSMSTMFSKDAAERDAIDKAAVFLLENILKHYAKVFLHYDDAEAEKYSKRTAVTVQRAENIWQAVVHEVKDIYVIKNIITSKNNISSNMLTLFLYGVTPMNGLRDMRIAWVGAEEHHRDSEQLFKLQNLLSTGYVTGDTSHIQSEIDRLNIAIKNNPVTEMINAGLMPTIVEDVANEDDPYSYKSAFIKSTEKYTSKLNSSVRSAGKVAYMSHDTKVYQSLARITQLSDFVARYALYQQLTTRKENPVSKEVAIQEASDAFINYDVPMNRNLQYMDDMGFFMFTKYFLRIQRVIRGRFIHSSGKMALMLGAESYLGSMPTIMDASVLVRAGNNPLGMGALQFPSAIGEIAPIAATRAMAHGLFNM